MIRAETVKIFVDGIPENKSAFMLAPYKAGGAGTITAIVLRHVQYGQGNSYALSSTDVAAMLRVGYAESGTEVGYATTRQAGNANASQDHLKVIRAYLPRLCPVLIEPTQCRQPMQFLVPRSSMQCPVQTMSITDVVCTDGNARISGYAMFCTDMAYGATSESQPKTVSYEGTRITLLSCYAFTHYAFCSGREMIASFVVLRIHYAMFGTGKGRVRY
eukprot:2803977-Rhodomonas_salina.1